MASWWSDLSVLKQIFYTVAVPSTLILIIQSAMAVVGLGDFDSDGISGDLADHDQAFDGDFKFFTIRGIVAFFSIFGWSGAVLSNSFHPLITVIIAFIAGALAMVGIGYLFYGMTRLQASGNIRFENSVGKTGEVYLTIPANKQGKGKVTVTVQERLIEVNALTLDINPIKSGEQVVIKEVLEDHTVIVERI